ncbi:MAG TPA: chaperone protein ClpB, partial [Chondromyces sp.]|nr:chaperone protein ClpB [Chondromyces sp.]
LNRVDDIVLFKPLSIENIKGIAGKLLVELEKRLEDQQIRLNVTEEAKELIAREGFDPVYGARPLKRFIQHHIETKLARAIIAGQIQPNGEAVIDAAEGELVVK